MYKGQPNAIWVEPEPEELDEPEPKGTIDNTPLWVRIVVMVLGGGVVLSTLNHRVHSLLGTTANRLFLQAVGCFFFGTAVVATFEWLREKATGKR
jgi:hypothetical protein